MTDEAITEVLDVLALVEADDAELPAVDQVEGEGYEGMSGGVIRSHHALNAIQNPDAFTVYRFEDHEAVPATRRVAGKRRSVVIAIAVRRDEGWRVTAAYRLREDDDERLDDLVGSPPLAFGTFLSRYGRTLIVGERHVLFAPVATLPPNALSDFDTVLSELGIDRSTPGLLHTVVTVPNPDEPTKFVWLFAIDAEAYRAEQH
jgi:hypothetical protein